MKRGEREKEEGAPFTSQMVSPSRRRVGTDLLTFVFLPFDITIVGTSDAEIIVTPLNAFTRRFA